MRRWWPNWPAFFCRPSGRGKLTLLVLALLRAYQLFLSPWFSPCCRFVPTCSHYTYEAVASYGWCRGLGLGLKRLLKCHPFHPGGFDPVP